MTESNHGIFEERNFIDGKGRRVSQLTPLHELGGKPSYLGTFAYQVSSLGGGATMKRGQVEIVATDISGAFEAFDEAVQSWVTKQTSRIVLPGRNGFPG